MKRGCIWLGLSLWAFVLSSCGDGKPSGSESAAGAKPVEGMATPAAGVKTGESPAPSSATPRQMLPADSATQVGNDPATVAALQAQVEELERELAALESSGLPTDLATLLLRLDNSDGSGMYLDMEKLLHAGEPGYKLLHDFFHTADTVDHNKILKLTHDPSLLFAMLRITALYPEEVAKFSEYLMRVTRDRPGSFIRREIFNFLPNFLNFHEGRFPELMAKLKAEIDFQLNKGGAYMIKVTTAMKDLNYDPPVSALMQVIETPYESANNGMASDALAKRADGLDALAKFVERADKVDSFVIYILKHLAVSDAASGSSRIKPFLDHVDPSLRLSSNLMYFENKHGADEFDRLLAFLNSPMPERAAQKLLRSVRQNSPELFSVLQEEAEAVQNQRFREYLLRIKSPTPRPKKAPATGGES